MTIFQILMLGASAYFAFKIYEHIGTLQNPPQNSSNNSNDSNNSPSQEPKTADTFSPFSPEELVDKADTAFEEKEYVKALALLNEADAKSPNSEEILFKLGYILQQSGNDEDAIKQYKRALEVNKENEFIHNSMASIYRKNREFTSAKIHLKASLDIDEENPVTYYNYGNLLVDTESFEEAAEMYEKAIELNPDFAEAKEELEKLKD